MNAETNYHAWLNATADIVRTVSLKRRTPSTTWAKHDPARRASITMCFDTLNDEPKPISVTISRSFYRGGERTYRNVTAASLRRVDRLFPFSMLPVRVIPDPVMIDALAAVDAAQAVAI